MRFRLVHSRQAAADGVEHAAPNSVRGERNSARIESARNNARMRDKNQSFLVSESVQLRLPHASNRTLRRSAATTGPARRDHAIGQLPGRELTMFVAAIGCYIDAWYLPSNSNEK